MNHRSILVQDHRRRWILELLKIVYSWTWLFPKISTTMQEAVTVRRFLSGFTVADILWDQSLAQEIRLAY